MIFENTQDIEAALKYSVIKCRSIPDLYEAAKRDPALLAEYDQERSFLYFTLKQLRLDKLTADELNIIYLRVECRYTYAELGKALGCSAPHANRRWIAVLDKLIDLQV